MTDLERFGLQSLECKTPLTLSDALWKFLRLVNKDRTVRRQKRKLLRALFPVLPQRSRRSATAQAVRRQRGWPVTPHYLDAFETEAYVLLHRQTKHEFWKAPPIRSETEFTEPERKRLQALEKPLSLTQFAEACQQLKDRHNSRAEDPLDRLGLCRIGVVSRKITTSPSAVLRNRLRRKIRSVSSFQVSFFFVSSPINPSLLTHSHPSAHALLWVLHGAVRLCGS